MQANHLQKQIRQNLIWKGAYFIVSFVTTIVTSRILAAEASGIYSYFLSALSLFVLTFCGGVEHSIIYYSAAKKIKAIKLLIAAIFITSIISCIVLLFFKANIYNDIIGNYKSYFNINQCIEYYLLGMILITFSSALLNGLQDFKSSNLVLVLINIIYLGLIFYNYEKGLVSLQYLVELFCKLCFLSGVCILIYCFIKLKREHLLQVSLPNFRDFQSLYKYGFGIMLSSLIFFLVYKIDYLLVKEWCSNEKELGNYIQASKFAQILLVVPQIISSTIFPQVSSRENREEIKMNMLRLMRIFSVSFLIILFVLIVAGKALFFFLFGESFDLMNYPMIILLPGIYFLAISNILSAYFNGIKRNKLNLNSAIYALILLLILSFIFKSMYSIYIAAAISSVCYIFETVYLIFKYRSEVDTYKWSDMFLLKSSDIQWIRALLKGGF